MRGYALIAEKSEDENWILAIKAIDTRNRTFKDAQNY